MWSKAGLTTFCFWFNNGFYGHFFIFWLKSSSFSTTHEKLYEIFSEWPSHINSIPIRNFINMVVLPTRLFAFSFGFRFDHLYPALSSQAVRCVVGSWFTWLCLLKMQTQCNSVLLLMLMPFHIDVDFDVHDYFDVDIYILKLDMLAAFV